MDQDKPRVIDSMFLLALTALVHGVNRLVANIGRMAAGQAPAYQEADWAIIEPVEMYLRQTGIWPDAGDEESDEDAEG